MKEITPESVIVFSVDQASKAFGKYKTVTAVRGGTSKVVTTIQEAENFFGVKLEAAQPKIEITIKEPVKEQPILIVPEKPPIIPVHIPYKPPMVTVEKCRKCDGDGIVYDLETRKIWNTEIALYGEKRTPPKQCDDCNGTGTKRRSVK
jgi:hypothetical protein